MASNSFDENRQGHRYISIACPSGKHSRSIVTFRNHTFAVMLCLACEEVWTEPTTHPLIAPLAIDRAVR